MEHIKGILAKNQQVLSQTSNEEKERVCTECGKPTQKPYRRCEECKQKAILIQYEQDKKEAEVELKEAIEVQLAKWEDGSNIPAKFLDKTFDNFDDKLQAKAYQSVKNLQWQWDDSLDNPAKSLILLSPGIYGVGKTHLVCALMNHIIKAKDKAILRNDLYIRCLSCPVYFVSENELARRIRNTYNRSNGYDTQGETEEDIYKRLARVSLLIIDDVGKVRPRDLNFLQGIYFNIIDQRYNDSLPVILTTNLGLNELEEHIGGACADRIREMAGKDGIVKMSGKSYRQQ